jgi:hypothetical protein
MATEIEAWQKEHIPDTDNVFFRAHRNLCPKGEIAPNVFREQNGGISTDWEKYSTAAECRNRARSPADNAVLRLNVGDVRGIDRLEVDHSPVKHEAPLPDNRAHSDILGLGKMSPESITEARVLLRRAAVNGSSSTPTSRKPRGTFTMYSTSST